MTRIRQFFSPPSRAARPPSPPKHAPAFAFNKLLNKPQSTKPRIKFVRRLTNEHILVGNEDQVDAMCLAGIISDFVDTEYLWTIRLRKAIIQVAVDSKSRAVCYYRRLHSSADRKGRPYIPFRA